VVKTSHEWYEISSTGSNFLQMSDKQEAICGKLLPFKNKCNNFPETIAFFGGGNAIMPPIQNR
jgi:hypothetical protein